MTTIFFPYNAGGSNGPDREQQRQNRQSARKSEDNDRRIAQKLRCTKCRMAVPANLKACMYCGEALSGEHTQSPFP